MVYSLERRNALSRVVQQNMTQTKFIQLQTSVKTEIDRISVAKTNGLEEGWEWGVVGAICSVFL